MSRFTVKVSEVARPADGQTPAPPRPIASVVVEASNCDAAADLARAWAANEVREVRSLNHAPGDAIVLVVYPQKR